MANYICHVLKRVGRKKQTPSATTLRSAEKLLNYIKDINLERPGNFLPTPAKSLYILWSVQDWEFHMECIKNGRIIYMFCKNGFEKARGSDPVDKFIPQLEKYLIEGVSA
jgi:hypothetical protein